MEYSVQELSKTKIEISLDVNKQEWAEQIKLAYEKKKHEFFVEGFRKGKVPMNVMINRFGAEIFYDDAIDLALNKYYGQILEEGNYEVVSRPELDIKEVSEDGLKATITVVLKPTFELGQYKGIDIEKPKAEVSEEEVDAFINKELDSRARLVTKEGAANKGDTVVIDFVGSVDGVKFEGGSSENFSLELGSNTFVPGFEDQLIGVTAGDAKDVKVTFPKDYTPELSDKEAVFAVTVKEIQNKELPTLDDEFVKDIEEELNTVEEYKAKVKADLLAKKVKDAELQLENVIMDAVVNKTEVEIPDCMVEEELDYQMQELERSMTQYGLKFEDYLKYTGAKIEDLRNEKKEEAVKSIKFRFVMEAIIKAENLTITAEDVEKAYSELPAERQKPEVKNYLANQIIIDKLFAFLKANNNII